MHVRPLHEFDLDHHTLLLVFFREDGEEAMYQDTDSDVAEQRDCGKVKVKWTQEEVSSFIDQGDMVGYLQQVGMSWLFCSS